MAEAKLKFVLEVDDKGTAKIKQFGQAVDQAGLTGGTFGAKMKAAATGVGSLAAGALKAAGALGAVGAAMSVGLGGKAVAAFAEYEEAVSRLAVVTGQSLDEVKKKIAGIGPEFGSQTELIKGYYDVLSAGAAQYGDEIEFLKTAAMMAKQAHIEQGEAVKGLATVMAAYGKQLGDVSSAANLLYNIEANGLVTVKEMIPYMGEVSNLAATSGLSFQEMAAGYAQMSKEGAGASAALTKFKAVIMGVQANFDKLPPSVKKYGDAAAAIKAIGFDGVLKQVAAATDMNVGAMTKMLGSQEAALGVIQLAKGGWSEYGAAIQGVTTQTDTFTRAWEGFKETLNGIWGTFKNIVQNFMISIGEQLAPTVKELVKLFGAWMESIKPAVIEWLKKAMEGLPEKIRAFRDAIHEAGGAWNLFVQYMEQHFPTLTKIGQGLAWVVEKVGAAIAALGEFNKKAEESGGEVMVEFMGMGSDVKPLGQKVLEMMDKLEVLARVANARHKTTVAFVGDAGGGEKPLGQAVAEATTKMELMNKKIELLEPISETAAASTRSLSEGVAAVGKESMGTAPKINELNNSLAENGRVMDENVIPAGFQLAYTMKSVRMEFDESGVALSEHAASLRQLADEYYMWAEGARHSALGMQLWQTYYDAARASMAEYRKELVALRREERERSEENGWNYNAPGYQGQKSMQRPKSSYKGAYQVGTGLMGVPSDGLFRLHRGEIVLNPEESRLMRSVAKRTRSEGASAATPAATGGGGGGGVSVTVTIAPQVMIGDRSGIRAVMPYIKDELDTYLRRTRLALQA